MKLKKKVDAHTSHLLSMAMSDNDGDERAPSGCMRRTYMDSQRNVCTSRMLDA